MPAMINLVRLALRRPYSASVIAMLIVLMGVLSVSRMPIDIFPIIDIPVVEVAWSYGGLSAEDMERRIVFVAERNYSTSVNGIERIESESIPGAGLVKIYFQQGADIGAGIAQITAANDNIIHFMPPGVAAPFVIQFDASNLPVVQMVLASAVLPEQQIYDFAVNYIRTRLFTIPGLSVPAPFGGRQRMIVVEADPARLSAQGFAAADLVASLQTSNVIVPAGLARIGAREYNVGLNSSPTDVERFNELPVGVRKGVTVLLGDVAKVYDSSAVQTNIVHVDGHRAAYLPILKHSDASTLTVVNDTRDILPRIQAAAPQGLRLNLAFDQSVFVRAAVNNVLREAVASSVLVSLMILVFLGSWRSTLIVSLSIPLSICAGLVGLFLTGQTINLMTLGGLALAVGLLVDNATVVVENIHRNQALGKRLAVAIMDGTAEVIQPLTVATLAVCIVFFPVVLLTGPARFLFIPLAITVVLAMLASYVLSFTVLPTFARYVLTEHEPAEGEGNRLVVMFESLFARLRDAYGRALTSTLHQRGFVLACIGVLVVLTGVLGITIGSDFFPTADVGIIKLHMRAPPGYRVETTEVEVLEVEKRIRSIIPASEIQTVNDLIGAPSSYNLAFIPSDNVSSSDAEILIALKTSHRPSIDYMRRMRADLPAAFPGTSFYFQNADIVNQVLNFGLSAPIDIQIQDGNFSRSYVVAQKLLQSIKKIPGVVDAHLLQAFNFPGLQVNVDRLRAAQVGVTQRDISSNLLTSLSSSAGVTPSFFLNPVNNVNYQVSIQVPLAKMTSVSDLMSIPISSGPPPLNETGQSSIAAPPSEPASRLSDVAEIVPVSNVQSMNHYTVQRILDVAANVDGRDLGSVAADIRRAIAEVEKGLPSTTQIDLRGQAETMNTAFTSLGEGLALAIFLVYALLVILFQSWVDPIIIMVAVPGALVGIGWMLALTGTTVNVESLMGAIMTVGISVSNSILVVSFANDIRVRDNLSPIEAVILAGRTRLRPILMTALAMVIGMLPMALGLGEAGEQNAPLGRAVIGGLAMATLATLFLVPVVYTLLRTKPPNLHALDRRFREETGMDAASGVAHG
jgi:multidrug efflux pump subunit AcrB